MLHVTKSKPSFYEVLFWQKYCVLESLEILQVRLKTSLPQITSGIIKFREQLMIKVLQQGGNSENMMPAQDTMALEV